MLDLSTVVVCSLDNTISCFHPMEIISLDCCSCSDYPTCITDLEEDVYFGLDLEPIAKDQRVSGINCRLKPHKVHIYFVLIVHFALALLQNSSAPPALIGFFLYQPTNPFIAHCKAKRKGKWVETLVHGQTALIKVLKKSDNFPSPPKQ